MFSFVKAREHWQRESKLTFLNWKFIKALQQNEHLFKKTGRTSIRKTVHNTLSQSVPIPLSSTVANLENQQPGSHWRSQTGFAAPEKLLSTEHFYSLTYLRASWKKKTPMVTELTQNSFFQEKPYPEGFGESNQQQLFTVRRSRAVTPAGTSRSPMKKSKEGCVG